jgi:hypothetical protein
MRISQHLLQGDLAGQREEVGASPNEDVLFYLLLAALGFLRMAPIVADLGATSYSYQDGPLEIIRPLVLFPLQPALRALHNFQNSLAIGSRPKCEVRRQCSVGC